MYEYERRMHAISYSNETINDLMFHMSLFADHDIIRSYQIVYFCQSVTTATAIISHKGAHWTLLNTQSPCQLR